MNEQENMMIDAKIGSLSDEPMPSHLHAKIMKRVFLAGYGRYLVFSAGIVILNLGVLALDLYRSLTASEATQAVKAFKDALESSPASLGAAARALYDMLPLSSLVATSLTIALSAYVATVFIRVYRNPNGVKLIKA